MQEWRPKQDDWSSSAGGQKVARSCLRNASDPATTTKSNNGASEAFSNRFERDNRLLNAADYSRVFKKAKRSRDEWFTVLWRENKGTAARLGLAVSKKHCKLAVSRNRIKRLARESFRQHKATLNGIDVVVMNQPTTHKASNARLLESLAGHWQECCAKENVPQEQR